jgi:hypothetical protein
VVMNSTWIIRELTSPDLLDDLWKRKSCLLWHCEIREGPTVSVPGPWKERNGILCVEIIAMGLYTFWVPYRRPVPFWMLRTVPRRSGSQMVDCVVRREFAWTRVFVYSRRENWRLRDALTF